MSMIDLHAKTMIGPVIRLHPNDNVVVARTEVGIGMSIPSEGITSRSQVPSGHKIAARAISAGEPILKYNVVIGFAATDIAPGTMCTRTMCLSRNTVATTPTLRTTCRPPSCRPSSKPPFRAMCDPMAAWARATTLVFCPPSIARPPWSIRWPRHSSMASWTPSPTSGGYARNPNFAAVLIIGLGCERNQMQGLLEQEGLQTGPKLYTFVMQEEGGTRKTVQAAVAAVEAMLPEANQARRRLAVRRVRWFFVDHRQSRLGGGHGHSGAPWRYRHFVGNARNLRR